MWRELDAVFADPSLDRLQRRAVWFMRTYLLEDPAIFQAWDAAEDLPDHRKVIARVMADAALFPHPSAHAQDIVVNVLVDESATDPTFLSLLFNLGEAGALEERHQDTFDHAIDAYPFGRLGASGMPLRAYASRIVETLRIHNWDTQNSAIPPLRNAGPDEVGELDPGMQEALGRNVMQAAEGNAWSARNFLGGLSLEGVIWPVDFVRGVLLEPFANEAGELRLKPRTTGRAVRTLRAAPPESRDGLVDEIIAAIRQGSPRSAWNFRGERPDVIDRLRQIAEDEDLVRVAEIADALDEVRAEDEFYEIEK